MRQKNYSKAVSLLKEGIRGQKSDALLYNSMAAALFADKKEAEGIRCLLKAKEVDPDFFTPYFNLAVYYVSKKNADKAINEYQGVLLRAPQNIIALVNMAVLFEAKGRNDDALAYYQRAKETKQAGGFIALANYYARQKESNKSIGVLDEAIRADARNATAMELKGKIYIAEKKYKEAAKVFDQLENVDPDRALPLKIGTYVSMKDIPKAVECAKKIINKKPDSAYGYTVLASVYEGQNDLGNAMDALRSGLRVDAKNIQANMMLGNLYVKKRDYPAALSIYEGIVKKTPSYSPAIFAQGTVYDQLGKKTEAVKKYREVLSKSASYVPALNNLAYLYSEGYGSKGEALKLAASAYRLEPNNAGVIDTMGYVLLKNGKRDDARKLLEKAVSLIPNDPSVHYHLAMAYKESGDKVRALKSVQKSLELGNFTEAKSAKLLLAELKR
jgi:tetratricopeptide (TPR) repeat protein